MKELRIDEIQKSLKHEIYFLNNRPLYASIFENKNLGLAYKLNDVVFIKCMHSPYVFLAGDMSKKDVEEITSFFRDRLT